MVVPTIFYFILKESYWLAHQQFLLEHWACPNISTSLDLQVQNKANVLLLEFTFVVHIHESWTLGKPYGIKPRCYCAYVLLATYARTYLGTRRKKKHLSTCDGISKYCRWGHGLSFVVLVVQSVFLSVPFHLLRLTESAGIMVYIPHHCDLNLALLWEST
jgi:hypothetical protein